jgi:ribonuclease P/MRP protein subunit RPP1
MEFFDLHVSGNAKELEAVSSKLGWARIAKPAEIKFKNVQEEARKLRKDFEVIIAGGDDAINRLASDCWEVDIIGSPEVHEEGDFMHQMNSGVDYVIAKACAEKGIAVEICFANMLNSYGRRRAQVMARMSQNVSICRDCGCDIVITSGAKDKFGLRAPRDLVSFGIVLGMRPEEALKAVSENPAKILKRAVDRKNPNIITKGLEVKKWGSKHKEKKISGWY